MNMHASTQTPHHARTRCVTPILRSMLPRTHAGTDTRTRTRTHARAHRHAQAPRVVRVVRRAAPAGAQAEEGSAGLRLAREVPQGPLVVRGVDPQVASMRSRARTNT